MIANQRLEPLRGARSGWRRVRASVARTRSGLIRIVKPMKTESVLRIVLLPVAGYGAIAVFALLVFRMAYGHAASTPFSSFLMWSGIGSAFALLIGALFQARLGLRRAAVITAVSALIMMFAAAHLAPYLAR